MPETNDVTVQLTGVEAKAEAGEVTAMRSYDPTVLLAQPSSKSEYDLKQLREAGDRALSAAQQHKSEIDGAINWRDLHCVAALRVEDDLGRIHYRIEIEEAADDNLLLQRYVADYLKRAGFADVAVYTEW